MKRTILTLAILLIAVPCYADFVFNPITSKLDIIGTLQQSGTFIEEPTDYQNNGSFVVTSGTFNAGNNITLTNVGGVATVNVPDIWVNTAGDTMTGTLTSVDIIVQAGSDITVNDEVAGGTQCAQFVNGVLGGTGSGCVGAVADIWVNEAGDTMTGSLNFSGVTNDITSDANEDIALNAGGTGSVAVVDDKMVIGGVGADMAADAALDIISETKGLLVPRPSAIADIGTPVNGMIAYDAGDDNMKARINGNWVSWPTSVATGDITQVFNVLSGAATTPVVQSGQSLTLATGGEVEATENKVPVYNDSGATLYACTAVYQSGYDAVTGFIEVSIADADDAAKMPAKGIVTADIANGSSGFITAFGQIGSLDTDTVQVWTSGDALFVNTSGTSTSSDCAETLTSTAPTGSGEIPQQVGTVSVVDGSVGQIFVAGADRIGDGSGGLPAGTGTETQYRLNASSFGAVNSSSYAAGTKTLTYGETVVVSGTLVVPSGTAPTTDAAGEIAFDTNAHAASRGALQVFDGTANTEVVATLASDTPTNGQVPKWNTGGTVTWEDDGGGAGGGGFEYAGSNNFLTTTGTNAMYIGTGTAYQAGGDSGAVITAEGTIFIEGSIGIGTDPTDPDNHFDIYNSGSSAQFSGGINSGDAAAASGIFITNGTASSYVRVFMPNDPTGMREHQIMDLTGTVAIYYSTSSNPCGGAGIFENFMYTDSGDNDACICKSGVGVRRTDESTACH